MSWEEGSIEVGLFVQRIMVELLNAPPVPRLKEPPKPIQWSYEEEQYAREVMEYFRQNDK
jgi:hypothetical protein